MKMFVSQILIFCCIFAYGLKKTEQRNLSLADQYNISPEQVQACDDATINHFFDTGDFYSCLQTIQFYAHISPDDILSCDKETFGLRGLELCIKGLSQERTQVIPIGDLSLL